MKKLIIIFMTLFIAGCTTTYCANKELKKVPTSQIEVYSILNFTDRVIFLDEWYTLPTVEMIEEFNNKWEKAVKDYVVVAYDCDDFADEYQRDFKNYIRKKYGKFINVAVFKFCYMHKMVNPHAINIIYADDDVYFVEPQSGKFMKLTEEEKKSCLVIID